MQTLALLLGGLVRAMKATLRQLTQTYGGWLGIAVVLVTAVISWVVTRKVDGQTAVVAGLAAVVVGTGLFVYHAVRIPVEAFWRQRERISALVGERDELAADLVRRTSVLGYSQPAFQNMLKVITAFITLRKSQPPVKLRVVITAPPEHHMTAITLSQLITLGCECHANYHNPPDGTEPGKAGSVANRVVVRYPEGAAWFRPLQLDLESVLRMEPVPGLSGVGDSYDLWLQIGPGAVFASEPEDQTARWPDSASRR